MAFRIADTEELIVDYVTKQRANATDLEGRETPTGAQDKANAALASANAYTDQEVQAAVKAGAVNPRTDVNGGYWDIETAYDTLDLVAHRGSSWYAKAPTVAGQEPGSDAIWVNYADGLNEATANAAYAPVGLASDAMATAPAVGPAVTSVQSTGYSVVGKGAARYIYDAAVDAAYVTANPRTSFLAADGRGFRLPVLPGVNPFQFGALGGGTDDTAALVAFLDSLEANDYGTAEFDGVFTVTGPLALTNPLTKRIVGDTDIIAGAAINTVVTVEGLNFGQWDRLKVTGTGGTSFASRTCRVGVEIIGCGRGVFGHLDTRQFSFAGVLDRAGNSNMAELKNVVALDCGSGHDYVDGSVEGTWSNPVRVGTAGSTGQTTEIDVSTLPPSFITDGTFGAVDAAPFMVRVAGRLHYIRSIDTVNSKLSIYPWIPTTATPGSFRYVFGGGVYLTGVDTNVFGLGMVDTTRCGMGLLSGALYGPSAERLVSQFCGAGLVTGVRPESASAGGRFENIYAEGNFEDIVCINVQGDLGFNYFDSAYEESLAKCYALGVPLFANDTPSTTYEGFSRSPLRHRGKLYLYEKRGNNEFSSTVALTPERRDQMVTVYSNTKTFPLQPINLDVNRLTGVDSIRLCVLGTGTANEPTGTMTFTPPSGWTVNGLASVDFSGFTKPPVFVIFYRISASNVLVSLLN